MRGFAGFSGFSGFAAQQSIGAPGSAAPITLSNLIVPVNAPNDTVIGTLSGGSGFYLLVNNGGRQFKLDASTIKATGVATGKGPITITVRDLLTKADTNFVLTVDTAPAFPTLAGGAPVRGWTFTGASGSSVAGAFGTSSALTLVGSPTLAARGPMDQGIGEFNSASSQYGTFPALDLSTSPSSMEIWVAVAVRSLTTGKSILGRSGSANSQIQISNGGASLNVRTQSGSSTTVAIPQLTLGFNVFQFRYDVATGNFSGSVNGVAITPVAVGTQGFTFDQLGRINTGTFANQFYGDIAIFDRLLSSPDQALMAAYFRQWQSRVYYIAASGSDSSTTPWCSATPRQTMLSAATYHSPGDTVALKSGDIFRPAVATALAAGIVYDGGLWGDAYVLGEYGYRYAFPTADLTSGADIRFSTAPTLTLVSGTIYSFARAAAPKAKVWRVTGDNGRTVTALNYNSGAGTNPAVGECGHSGGLVYVNAGVALTTGEIEDSIDSPTDGLALNGANTVFLRSRVRFCQATGVSHSQTSGTNIADRVAVEWNQGDGHNCFGAAITLNYGGVSRYNGATAISGSDGDGYSCHGTSTATYYGCVSVGNFRTQSRHLVSTTINCYGCLHIGRHPLSIVTNVATPSVNGIRAYACLLIAEAPNADGTPAYGLFNEYGGGVLTAVGCTIALTGTNTGSIGARAEVSGGSVVVQNCIITGFQQGFSAQTGATVTESYNRINVTGSARVNVSAGTGSSTGDPGLDANYRPVAGSAVIGAGVAATGNEYDAVYVERPDPPAIGALEP